MGKVTDFVALDVETANADFSSICAIGLVHFRAGQVFKSLTILVDPEDEFDDFNIGIHGIRPEDVVGKPTMARIFPIISASLSDVVVIHHSHFDKTALNRAASKYSAGLLPCVWLDTLRVARRTWPSFDDGRGYGLARLAAEFNINFQHHDAAEDARAAGLLMLRAIQDSGYGLEDWLARVELTLSGETPGRFAREGDPSGPLAGETVVFTGKLELPRRIVADAAAKAGCSVSDSVSKRTTILVVGDQDLRRTKGNLKSAKHRKAEALLADGFSIRIVGESDFMLMADVSHHLVSSVTEVDQNVRVPTPTHLAREFILSPEATRIEILVERVKALKRSKDYASAIELLFQEIECQERNSVTTDMGVAPWYYEQAAIILRKIGDPEAEVRVLERFAMQRHAPGVGPGELLLRLEKAKARLSTASVHA